MMFPSVWSSLLMVNKQALGTFVSLLMVILRGCTGYRDVTDPRGAGNGGGLGGKARAPPSPRPPRSNQGLISRPPAVPSLFLALEEQEGLEGRRRVHPAVAMAAAAPFPQRHFRPLCGAIRPHSAPRRAGGLGAGTRGPSSSGGLGAAAEAGAAPTSQQEENAHQ